MIDADGYLFVMGRIDDVINVAGHRLSTGAIEEAVAAHPDVAECAVFAIPDELRGHVPLGLVVLKAGAVRDPDELQAELVAMVRDQVGAVAYFRDSRIVQRLPKTRSGKILRGDDAGPRRGPRGRGALDDRGPGRPGRDRRGARPPRGPADLVGRQATLLVSTASETRAVQGRREPRYREYRGDRGRSNATGCSRRNPANVA